MYKSYTVPQILAKRELDSRTCFSLQKHFHVTKNFIERLSLEKELDGHSGCVNCLEWDEGGTVLASGSDDFCVIIWDPFLYKPIKKIETGHHGNIFSVKFMPETKNEILITGAGDCEIRVHNVLNKITKVCTCHTGRVKRLATAPSVLNVFWSAAEDGLIRQYDLRMPHVCNVNETAILIDLRTHSGEITEAKCLCINPMKPELLAVGANDPYVRLYDRRMIKVVKCTAMSTHATAEDNLAPGCVQYFAPGHIAGKLKMTERELRSYSATYVTFDPNGHYLLANLGREQIYLYDINSATAGLLIHHNNNSRELNDPLRSYCNGFADNVAPMSTPKPPLPERVNSLRLTGNTWFEKAYYTKSIRFYNEAIGEYPYSSVLYSNRAAALMKREWSGDIYAALRDCLFSLKHDPTNAKAYFRIIRCLYKMEWYEESKLILENFKKLFPSYAKLIACQGLEHDIDAKLLDKKDVVKSSVPIISTREYGWRENANDYLLRFYDHCNTMTDIKEANFFGNDGKYIVAGSDDGSIFIWDRKTTNNIRILKGDSSIVNCVQPHPSSCMLATSGIETCVRLWSPLKDDDRQHEVQEIDHVAELNQRRMQSDPFNIILMNISQSPNTHNFTYSCQNS